MNRFAHIILLGALFGTVLFWVFTFIQKTAADRINTKPHVHAWEHNGITMLCADEDFNIGIQSRDRDYVANPIRRELGNLLPTPNTCMLFSENPAVLKDFKDRIFPVDDLLKVTEGCTLIESKMRVPSLPDVYHGRSGATTKECMRRLIWGADVEVPEKLKV